MRKPLWYARAWRFRWGTIQQWLHEKTTPPKPDTPESTWERMQRESIAALENPQPGDYWSDMFAPVLVVVEATQGFVIFLDRTVSTDANHWTWDLKQQKTVLTIEEFRDKLCYKAEGMQHKPWCECQPRGHLWVIEALKELEKS